MLEVCAHNFPPRKWRPGAPSCSSGEYQHLAASPQGPGSTFWPFVPFWVALLSWRATMSAGTSQQFSCEMQKEQFWFYQSLRVSTPGRECCGPAGVAFWRVWAELYTPSLVIWRNVAQVFWHFVHSHSQTSQLDGWFSPCPSDAVSRPSRCLCKTTASKSRAHRSWRRR